MILPLDTHLLLWAASNPARLSPDAIALLSDPKNELIFTGSNEMEFRSEASRGEADGRSGGAQYVGA